MPKRKSFLEKLTGAIEVDKEEKNTELPQPKKKELKHIKPNQENKENKTEKKKEKEEWLDQQEGQLTVDVYQTDQDIVIKSTIAGVLPQELDIAITNDMVTIKGTRVRDEEVPEENYYYQECYWGPFSRSIILPLDVDTEKASATMKNGILTVRLPKVEKSRTKKIKIKTG